MKFRALSLAALCGACLLSAAKLEAAMGDFTYATSVAAANSPTVPSAPSPFPGGPATTLLDIGNGNSLSFVGTNTPDVAGAAFPGGADINFGRVDFLPDAGNATVTPYNANYNFTVQLTDVASGDQGVVNFTGAIRGNAAGGASASINTETFSFAVAPQQLVLGRRHLPDRGEGPRRPELDRRRAERRHVPGQRLDRRGPRAVVDRPDRPRRPRPPGRRPSPDEGRQGLIRELLSPPFSPGSGFHHGPAAPAARAVCVSRFNRNARCSAR